MAFDMPVDGEKAIGEEKPERGSPVNAVGDTVNGKISIWEIQKNVSVYTWYYIQINL